MVNVRAADHGIPWLVAGAPRLAAGTAMVTRDGPWHEVWDRFYEAGGRTFDAAFHYGERAERTLGDWLRSRGVRSAVTVIGKGAHTPHCRPEAVAPQLSASLERLGVDSLDLYLLHRDNPAIPVGEFVDALDAEVRSGRVGAVGVSNWTHARAGAFDAYAAANGRSRLAALSNQLSLAEMLEPPWAGCLGAHDDATRAWLAQRQLPLLAWSAAARGFFSGRSGRQAEMRLCWTSEENAARRRRAQSLARRLGVPPVAVALGWVLHQPFPSIAVVGPRDQAELAACLAVLDVSLSPAEADWLERGAGRRPRA